MKAFFEKKSELMRKKRGYTLSQTRVTCEILLSSGCKSIKISLCYPGEHFSIFTIFAQNLKILLYAISFGKEYNSKKSDAVLVEERFKRESNPKIF